MTMMSWTMGRVSGRVSSLAVDPTNENVLYLGSASGGVWKTTNGGTSWTPVFDAAGTLSIGALALDPGNPSVLWVGTGEQGNSCTGYFGMGAFRSTDGGATFQARNGSGSTALQLSHFQSIAVQPGNGQTVLAAGTSFCTGTSTPSAGGVFRTTDGGASWTKVLSGSAGDVVGVQVDERGQHLVRADAHHERPRAPGHGAQQLAGPLRVRVDIGPLRQHERGRGLDPAELQRL
jgi:hypothetical protein